MLLTYGNIKKSKFLKYIYLSDYNDDEYRKAFLEQIEERNTLF